MKSALFGWRKIKKVKRDQTDEKLQMPEGTGAVLKSPCVDTGADSDVTNTVASSAHH